MSNPVDSMIVQLHSTYSSLFLISCWLFATCYYYTSDPILCVSKFDRSVVASHIEHMCLTYSYTQSSLQTTRYYVLHYKWIHWMFLLLALIYKISGFIMIHLYSPNYLLSTLKNLSYGRYYNLNSRSLSRSIWYWQRNYGRHGDLHRNKCVVHIVSLLTNAFAFLLINQLLQGNYYVTLIRHWPFTRDFTDALSSLFPAFTECEISPKMQLWWGRTERVGCHLPLMEVYEKVFLVLWVWQGILAVATLLYLIHMQVIAGCCGGTGLAVLCSGGQEMTLLLQKFRGVGVGELMALGTFKEHLTKAQMRCLLYTIATQFFHVQ